MAASRSYFPGGDYVELLSAQGKSPAATWKQQGKILKSFDKSIKGNAYHMDGSSETKMQLPKSTTTASGSLGLTQRFVVAQLLVPFTKSFSLEIGFADFQKIRRRLVFASAFRETTKTTLHVQIPLGSSVPRDQWVNLVVDLQALTEYYFPGAAFRSMESICISGSCKLKRIFTMKDAPRCDTLAARLDAQIAAYNQNRMKAKDPASVQAPIAVARYADMKEIPRQFMFSSSPSSSLPIPTEYFLVGDTGSSADDCVTPSTASTGMNAASGIGAKVSASTTNRTGRTKPASRIKSAPSTTARVKVTKTRTTAQHNFTSHIRNDLVQASQSSSPPRYGESEPSLDPPEGQKNASRVRSAPVSKRVPTNRTYPLNQELGGREPIYPSVSEEYASPPTIRTKVRHTIESHDFITTDNHPSPSKITLKRVDLESPPGKLLKSGSATRKEDPVGIHRCGDTQSRRSDGRAQSSSDSPDGRLPSASSPVANLQMSGDRKGVHASYQAKDANSERRRRRNEVIAAIQSKLDRLTQEADDEEERDQELFLKHTSLCLDDSKSDEMNSDTNCGRLVNQIAPSSSPNESLDEHHRTSKTVEREVDKRTQLPRQAHPNHLHIKNEASESRHSHDALNESGGKWHAEILRSPEPMVLRRKYETKKPEIDFSASIFLFDRMEQESDTLCGHKRSPKRSQRFDWNSLLGDLPPSSPPVPPMGRDHDKGQIQEDTRSQQPRKMNSLQPVSPTQVVNSDPGSGSMSDDGDQKSANSEDDVSELGDMLQAKRLARAFMKTLDKADASSVSHTLHASQSRFMPGETTDEHCDLTEDTNSGVRDIANDVDLSESSFDFSLSPKSPSCIARRDDSAVSFRRDSATDEEEDTDSEIIPNEIPTTEHNQIHSDELLTGEDDGDDLELSLDLTDKLGELNETRGEGVGKSSNKADLQIGRATSPPPTSDPGDDGEQSFDFDDLMNDQSLKKQDDHFEPMKRSTILLRDEPETVSPPKVQKPERVVSSPQLKQPHYHLDSPERSNGHGLERQNNTQDVQSSGTSSSILTRSFRGSGTSAVVNYSQDSNHKGRSSVDRRLANLLESTDWSQLPFSSVVVSKTAEKNRQPTKSMPGDAKDVSGSIELVYDPILRCYYDPIGKKYYSIAT